MRKRLFISILVVSCLVVSVNSHDLFLKFDSYFLRPNSTATVRLLNGSFRGSEGAVARERMQDVTLVSPEGGVSHPPATNWRDEGKTALLNLETGRAGTYVVGVSTKHREIDLKAKDFNEYLAHDGLPDTLAARRKNGELNRDVRERYSKHVRAIFQVGEQLTEDYKTPLGYPVEIIPQQNPYSLKAGEILEVLCLLDGKPLSGQFVVAGWETATRRRSRPLNVRTDSAGIARIKLGGRGKWYVKLIHMTPLNEAGVNYESKWATLTFAVK